MGGDHKIVYLDANEGDFPVARAVAEIEKLQELLDSAAAKEVDETIKAQLAAYVKCKKKTVNDKDFLDAMNISSKGVAVDLERKLRVEQDRATVVHLINAVISTDTTEQRMIKPPAVASRPRRSSLPDLSGDDDEVALISIERCAEDKRPEQQFA